MQQAAGQRVAASAATTPLFNRFKLAF